MNQPLLFAGVSAVALLVGLVVGWFAGRGRAASLVAAASTEAKASVQGELATLTERANGLAASLADERQQHSASKQSLEALRSQLDTASNEIATLTERSRRVPALEAEIGTLESAAAAREAELRQVSSANAQSSERAAQLAQQLTDVNNDLDEARRQLQSTASALHQSNEARASLEEQARRVPSLEGEVTTLSAALEGRETELRQLSTTNGQNAERATQLGQQLADTTGLLSETQQRLEVTSSALQQANETKAGLEQQALRVPGLEQQLSDMSAALTAARDELAGLRESSSSEVARLAAELAAEREALSLARREGGEARTAALNAEARVAELTTELTELRTRTDDERTHSEEKLQMLLQARDALSDQFKTLASEILEEKSKRFAEQNQTNLGQLLDPLRTQLSEFKGKVEEVYVQEGKDRSALSEQVRQLVALNQALSEDAKSLTQALKGQAKTQGNWGELILERVLEASGLRKGFEYKVQDSQVREDGSRAQPDVVIELPEERKLVVDAKVSLVAYERFVSADTDEERALAVKQHLASVREHIRGLSEKSYHQLYGVQSPDFVLAFVPVEPAFMVAVTTDNELFMDAWQRNVLLVSPSTLLFVVRTVAHLWRQEAQSRNAQDIAKRGAMLYDKLVGFAEDLEKVGKTLNQAKASYDQAYSKLVGGQGNAIRQAEMLKTLGVKPTKSLPRGLIEAAGSGDDMMLPAPTLAALVAPTSENGAVAIEAATGLND